MPKKANIQKWEASMLRMNEDRFFDIIHAYFGEIETPFNKHKLLERLSSFLLNAEVRKGIINTLSYEEIKILSCIHYLKNPTVSTIRYAFDIYPSELKKKLINFEERLLIYRELDDYAYIDVRYSINPLLLDALLPFLGNSLFLPYEKLEKPISIQPLLTPVFFSSFYSYISNNTDVFKKDGSCKKKVADNLSAIFHELDGDEETIELIFDCFINLKLIKKCENEVVIIEEHWKKFASLSHFEKLVYMCIAKVFYIDGTTINPAKIFSELLWSLKEGAWYSDQDINIALFLNYQKYLNATEPISLNTHDTFFNTFRYFSNHHHNQILNIAKKFGLVIERMYSITFNEYFRNIEEDEKPLLLSSTYEVTISQNASLNNLLSILQGVKVVKSQTFATFEFNRQTCEKLFQKEMDANEIIEKLQCVSKHPIPQNIIASIEQWYKSYKSISLYSGFVLCVDEKKRKFFEKGTPISNLIKKEISEGVYLLTNSNIKEINKQLKKAGLDYIFFNNKDYRVNSNLTFVKLEKDIKVSETAEKKDLLVKLKKCEDERLSEEKKLIKKLESEQLDENIKDVLLGRIKRRVILNENQLEPTTISKSVREIRAFDFLGKVKFLEEAKAQEYLLEITTNDNAVVIGYVIDLSRNFKDNIIVNIEDITDHYLVKNKYIDVSQILKIKIVVQSIFS